jgi:CubicO group peptidase (beta-lactamase class C family)
MKPITKEYVEHELAQYKFPGMGIGVIKDGEVLQAEGFGFADLEKKTLIDKDTEWGIASCSKAFTATLLCMLAEDGYFGLEQPIREYLPDFQLYDETATKLCTVKDILCHRTKMSAKSSEMHFLMGVSL